MDQGIITAAYILAAILFILSLGGLSHQETARRGNLAGIVGMAISWGVKRGIYSNEAGQGTGPMAAAAAHVTHPVKQGLVQAEFLEGYGLHGRGVWDEAAAPSERKEFIGLGNRVSSRARGWGTRGGRWRRKAPVQLRILRRNTRGAADWEPNRTQALSGNSRSLTVRRRALPDIERTAYRIR